jgi:hypothetical protein
VSWSEVRPYFRTILDTRGYGEWKDGFATDNIPASALDRSFHIQLGPISGLKQNQSDQESEVAVTLRTYYKGYRDPLEAIDFAISETEAIVKECVKVVNRAETTGILNVIFQESNIDPIDASNDNAVVVTSSYSVRVILDVT